MIDETGFLRQRYKRHYDHTKYEKKINETTSTRKNNGGLHEIWAQNGGQMGEFH